MNRSSKRFRNRRSLPDLLFAQLNEHRAALLRWQPVALLGVDPEGVHKMRVATRRLRMLLRTFRGLFDTETEQHLIGELRWLARILGRARDADVCEIEVTRIRARLPPGGGIETYCAYLRAAGDGAHAELREVLTADRYANLVDALEPLNETHAHTTTVKRLRKRSFKRQAVERVRANARKVQRRGRHINAASSVSDYHRLRIAAKQLRYLLDFLSIAQPRKWQPAIAALTQLQDLLGEHQDAVTAGSRHRAFAADLPLTADSRELLLTMGRLLQIEAERTERCREAFPGVWSMYTNTLRALLPR